jgi:hypothetical protein
MCTFIANYWSLFHRAPAGPYSDKSFLILFNPCQVFAKLSLTILFIYIERPSTADLPARRGGCTPELVGEGEGEGQRGTQVRDRYLQV